MGHHLRACLESLYGEKQGVDFEVILVNKPSEDPTEETLRDYPEVKLISMDRFGISLMRNRGVREASGKHILILDIDTEVKQGALKALVKFLEKFPRAGVVGGKTYHPDGELELSCKRFYTLTTVISRRTPLGGLFPQNRWERRHLMKDEDHNQPLECDWVAGACFLIRRQTLEEVGLFDEAYYFGFEDVDYCYRVKQAGWEVRYCPEAELIHHVQHKSRRFNRFSWEHLKSGLHFWWKKSKK